MLAVLLGGLSMVSPFSIDTFFPAFHAMEKGLQVNAAQLQQVITAYMVPFAFASLVHGPLSDALGRRPVMIWGMALYTCLIHISEPTRLLSISYAVFCLKKKKK